MENSDKALLAVVLPAWIIGSITVGWSIGKKAEDIKKDEEKNNPEATAERYRNNAGLTYEQSSALIGTAVGVGPFIILGVLAGLGVIGANRRDLNTHYERTAAYKKSAVDE